MGHPESLLEMGDYRNKKYNFKKQQKGSAAIINKRQGRRNSAKNSQHEQIHFVSHMENCTNPN